MSLKSILEAIFEFKEDPEKEEEVIFHRVILPEIVEPSDTSQIKQEEPL